MDTNGNKVFSDTAPPLNTPDQNIIKRPGSPTTKRMSIDMDKPSAPDLSKTGTQSFQLKELEAKKMQAEEAEKAKKQAEEDKLARARADNCRRARQSKAAFESGVRLSTTNEKGERVFMDEKTRMSEQQRLQEIIQSDCAR